MIGKGAAIGLLVGVLAAAGAPARAHPHVFVESALVVQAAERGITELRLIWTFDEMFSSVVIADHDKNRDGKLQPAEIRSIRSQAFDNLRHYGYFLQLVVDGKPVLGREVAAFDARIVNRQLVYIFSLRLPQPASAIEMSQVDPEFFVAFSSNASYPIQVEAAGGAADCSAAKAKEIETGYGSITPDRFTCTVRRP